MGEAGPQARKTSELLITSIVRTRELRPFVSSLSFALLSTGIPTVLPIGIAVFLTLFKGCTVDASALSPSLSVVLFKTTRDILSTLQ